MSKFLHIRENLTELLLAAGGNKQEEFMDILGVLIRALPVDDEQRNVNFLNLIMLAGSIAADAALSPHGTHTDTDSSPSPCSSIDHREQSKMFLKSLVETKFRTRAQYWEWSDTPPGEEWVAWAVSLADGSGFPTREERIRRDMELSAEQSLSIGDRFALHTLTTMLLIEELYENPAWWGEGETLRDAAAACVAAAHTYTLTHKTYNIATAERTLADMVNKNDGFTPSDNDIDSWLAGA